MSHHLEDEKNLTPLVSGNVHPCVIKWGAKWCGPCVKSQPYFDNMAKTYHKINFISIDVDKHKKLAQLHNISSIPRFDVYANGGRVVKQIVGWDEHALLSAVQKLNK